MAGRRRIQRTTALQLPSLTIYSTFIRIVSFTTDLPSLLFESSSIVLKISRNIRVFLGSFELVRIRDSSREDIIIEIYKVIRKYT